MRRLSFCLLLALVLGLTSRATAGPLEPSLVPMTAQSCLHLDIDAAGNSTILCQMGAPLWQTPALQQLSAALPSSVQFLRRGRLHDVTVYSHASMDDLVAIVHIDIDTPQLMEVLTQATEFATIRYHADRVHSWVSHEREFEAVLSRAGLFQPRAEQSVKPEDDRKPLTFYFARLGEKRFAVSLNLRSLLGALDVVAGRAESFDAASWEDVVGPVSDRVVIQGYNLDRLATQNQKAAVAGKPVPIKFVLAADEQLTVDLRVDLSAVPTAVMIESLMSNPVALAGMLKQFAESTQQQSDHEKQDPEVAAGPVPDHRHCLKIGAGLETGDEEGQQEKLVQYVAEHLRVSRDESILDVHWQGVCQVEYEYRFENHVNCHTLNATLVVDQDPSARTARGPQGADRAKTDR